MACLLTVSNNQDKISCDSGSPRAASRACPSKRMSFIREVPAKIAPFITLIPRSVGTKTSGFVVDPDASDNRKTEVRSSGVPSLVVTGSIAGGSESSNGRS
jgi:hypothetical protein